MPIKTAKVRKRTARNRRISPGMAISFLYPRHNFHGVLSKLEFRRIAVIKVRDLVEEPLDPLTVKIQPLQRRGRFLVIGRDLDKNEVRSFYHRSMQNVAEIEPTEGTVPVFLVDGKVFASAVEAGAFAETVVTARGVQQLVVRIAAVPLTMFRPVCK